MHRLLFILLLILCSLPNDIFSQSSETQVVMNAPLFSLLTLDGQKLSLEALISKGPVIICFLGIGCTSCLEEMKEYQKIYNELKDDGVTVIGIPVVNEKTIAKVKPFIKSRGFTFPVLMDTDGKVSRMYYVQAVPYSVLINGSGKIVYRQSGYMRGDELIMRQKIKELFNSD